MRTGEVRARTLRSAGPRTRRGSEHPTVLADFGSTYTKLTVVDAATGARIAKASHLTTIGPTVLDGFDAALEAVVQELPDLSVEEVLACSSAAGGLRLGVVGLEKDLTAEAGRYGPRCPRGLVWSRSSRGVSSTGAWRSLIAEKPDILLLTGGTDGGIDPHRAERDGNRVLRSARPRRRRWQC